jgi:hypothetical protein
MAGVILRSGASFLLVREACLHVSELLSQLRSGASFLLVREACLHVSELLAQLGVLILKILIVLESCLQLERQSLHLRSCNVQLNLQCLHRQISGRGRGG